MLPSCGVEWEDQGPYFIQSSPGDVAGVSKQGMSPEMHGSNNREWEHSDDTQNVGHERVLRSKQNGSIGKNNENR